jgi:hypothetical protein
MDNPRKFKIKVMEKWGGGKAFLQSRKSRAWTGLLDLFL